MVEIQSTCSPVEPVLGKRKAAKRMRQDVHDFSAHVPKPTRGELSEEQNRGIDGKRGTMTISSVSESYASSRTSDSSSSRSSSVSSRSMSLVDFHALPLPVEILAPIERGNNSRVFLARMKQHPSVDMHPRDNEEACAEGEAGMREINMAVKIVNSSSCHVERELFCLRRLNDCHGEVNKNVRANDDSKTNSKNNKNVKLAAPSILPPTNNNLLLPSPKHFFTQSVGKHVAIGLELLGPDLFTFTERFILHEDELCFLGIELLRTVNAIHRCGVIHCSIKPENFCWNSHDIFNHNDVRQTTAVHNERNDTTPFLFKIIDYGRSSILTDISSLPSPSTYSFVYERPYRGWWYSLRGFLGKPMGQKDDLMSVVHCIGYLVEDYNRSGVSSRVSSAKKRNKEEEEEADNGQHDSISVCTITTAATTTTACDNNNHNNHHRDNGFSDLCGLSKQEDCFIPNQQSERNENLPLQHVVGENRCDNPTTCSVISDDNSSRGHCHSYSSWRHHFSDMISCAYRKASRKYTKLHKQKLKSGKHWGNRKERKKSRTEHKTYDATEHRNARRAWIVRHVEEEYLPDILPDVYYPRDMPQWWVEWFAGCTTRCNDDTVTTEEMSTWMMSHLQQKLEELGKTVEDMWLILKELYVRYHTESVGDHGDWSGSGDIE